MLGVLGFAAAARAQEPARTAAPAAPAAQAPQPPTDTTDSTVRFRLPTITVTAQKEAEDIQESPVSVTAVTADTLEQSGARSVSEASQFAPNTFFTEFTARKLSNPRFRGIGSSPNNPGVTTYIDGVPQLNANSSSIELLDVDQIEFVRGPQSALFGRNTLGGLVNITSARPSLAKWTGSLIAPFGNYKAGDVRATASGPLVADKLAVSFGAGYSGREGFTINDITGHDLDSRSAFFGKAQVLWTPNADWEIRGILNGERARDGDYALNDLQALRANPFHAARDFEGYTNRDLVSPTLLVSHAGKTIDLFSTTGFVWWKTADLTDLDYTPLPLITRDNAERDLQFTQEFRVASAKNAALALSKDVMLRWQAGLFLFTQGYTQDAVNSFAPSVLSPQLPFPIAQHSPRRVARRPRRRRVRPGHVDVQQPARRHDRCPRRPRKQDGGAQHVFRPRHCAREPGQRGQLVQRRLAAVHRHLPRQPPEHRLRDGLARLQSRRIQRRIAARQRSLRRGAQLELRGRHQELLARPIG